MDNLQNSPWLGLMSYEEKDAHLFYGRTKEIQELSGDIFNNTQTVVYGPSGTGKTSLIKAGVFSLARNNNYLPIYVRLNHESNESYSTQIIEKVRTSIKEIHGEIENLILPICENNISLWEFFHSNEFWDKNNYPIVPLIVIDQFEEIFTITKDRKTVTGFFSELSDLCDNKMPLYIREYLNSTSIRKEYPDKINYRLVLSLREDFLARLEEYAVNIPSLRRNRFSLQAINEEQAMDIILKPSDGMVSEDVAVEIIKKVTNNEKFKIDGIPEITVETALLSLFCNELNKKRIEDGLDHITIDLLERFGDNIIAEFYEHTMSLISERSMLYLENSLLTKKGYRDSIALGDAFEYGVTPNEIDILQQNRLIHVDEWDGAKRVEFSHDVLCKVAKESRDNKEELQKLEIEKERNKELEIEIIKSKKRKRTLIFSVIGLFLIIAGGLWWYLDAYVIEKEAFYRTTIKQFGWFVGKNKISKDEASHCCVYYRFSKKGSKSKHWTKIQAYDGYHHLTTNHTMITYLINQFDDEDKGANEKIKNKLKSVCQWESVADATGNFVVEERAYDKEGSFIYSCKNTRLKDDKQVMVSFFNEFGLPIIMRTDEANYIKITYDDKGNEVLNEFYDQDGFHKRNRDGAFMTKKEYDEEGFEIMEASLNTLGQRMIDNAGNCGWKARYKKGEKIWACSYDDKNEPCPTIHGDIETFYEYDEFGNITKIIGYDGYGNPDIDNSGVHSYILKYNDHGKNTYVEYRDTTNNLCENKDGVSIIIREYDNNGDNILEEFFDKTNKCIYRSTQNFKDGILQLQEIYYWNEDTDSLQLRKSYKFDEEDNIYSDWYPNDSIYHEWQYDSHGNLLYDAYYNSEKKTEPIMSSELGYHLHKFDIEYMPNKTILTEYYLDDYGKLVDVGAEYSKKIITVDSIKKIIAKALYDSQGTWIYTIKHQYDDNFTNMQSQTSIGLTGQPIRNGKDGAYYYKVLVEYSLSYDNFSTLVGENEFGEPSLIEGIDIVYHKQNLRKESNIYYDENGDEISDMQEYISNLPRAIHIEILDTTMSAYKYGVKDGDIIIGLGNWSFSYDKNFDKNYQQFKIEAQRLRNKKKQLIVVRHYPDLKTSKLLTFNLPDGLMGISFRPIYYTQKEKERLNKFLIKE